LQLDASGRAATVLAGTQVLFDGIAAPMLYSSASQVTAVAPFGIAGPTTQVQVVYHGKSATLPVPVVPAAPALFSLDGSGGGQGAILNEDGTENSLDNPAECGSVIVLYGTGIGQTTPPGQDGIVSDAQTVQTPVLPVTVQIDGQDAEILYAGAAPGMLQGFNQINVRVPETATPGYDIRVTISVGGYTSPNTFTVHGH
jgi:uncharacterized protein (TIGR03437 family)